MRKTVMVAAALLGACGGEDPPSCSQAIGHYYDEAGCAFTNFETGLETSRQEALSACVQVNQAVPDRCQGEFEDFLFCIDAASENRCDCTQESDALFGCD